MTVIKPRRDTVAGWAAAEVSGAVLADDELGYVTDEGNFVVGGSAAKVAALARVGSATYAGIPVVGLNVKSYGAVGDGRDVTDATITSGQTRVTSATAAFTSADVGRLAYFYGAGAAGALLVTTIAVYVSATQVDLTATAGTTVAAAGIFTFGTDDTTAITAAINAGKDAGENGCVVFPAGIFLCTAALPALTNTRDFKMTGVGGSGMSYGTYVTAPRPRTEVRYMAAGSAVFLPATTCKGFLMQDMAVTYGHPTYSGYLVSISTTWNSRFLRCVFGGSNKTVNLGVLFDVERVVEGIWEDVLFERCARAFRFNNYFNASTLTRCVFLGCRKINQNGNSGWGLGTTFAQCVFEPQDDSAGGDPFGAPSNLNIQNAKDVTLLNCAWWDATLTGAWINIETSQGVTIIGGYWGPNVAAGNEYLISCRAGADGLTIQGIACDGSAGTNKVFTYGGTPALTNFDLGYVLLNNTQLGLDVFPAGSVTWKDRASNGRSSIKTTAASGAALTLDATAEVQRITLDDACTFTFPVVTAIALPHISKRLRLLLIQDAIGSRLVTWPAGIKWAGGAAPTLSTAVARIDEIHLETPDNGTTWIGRLVASYY